MKRKFILLSLLSLLAPFVAADKVTDYKVETFKNWGGACNNQGLCSATSFAMPIVDADSAESSDTILTLKRDAAENSPAKLNLLGVGGELWDAQLIGEAISLAIAAQSFELGKFTEQHLADEKIPIPNEQTAAVLAAVQKADTATVLIGNVSTKLSLKGLSATLLYIDEQQKRIDTPTALLKKGTKPFTATVPVVATISPVIAADNKLSEATSAQVLDKIEPLAKRLSAELAECSNQADSELAVLDKAHYLLSVSCGGGAYNMDTFFFVAPKNKLEQMQLAKFDGGADGPGLLNGSAGYISDTGLLSNYYKARGLGDCGTDATWAWTGEQFTLVAMNVMYECQGNMNYLNVWQLNLATATAQ